MWRTPSHVFSYLLSLTTAQFCRFQMRSSFRYEDMMYLVFQDYQIIKSKFSYCLLIWMFWSRKSKNLIKMVHGRSLRIVANDKLSDFKTLFWNINEIKIHQKNLQILTMEVYKIINGNEKNYVIINERHYVTDSIAEKTDCFVLHLPPYHWIFNASKIVLN